MADVLNRTTKEFRHSVNTPDFPTADWIIGPDLSAVIGFAAKYWIITGDVVTLMAEAARDAIDAAEAVASLDAIADQLDAIDSKERADAKMIIRELNLLRAAMTTLSTEANAVAGSITVQNMPDRTLAQYKTQLRAELDGT